MKGLQEDMPLMFEHTHGWGDVVDFVDVEVAW
jgi:hypothetical protein